jgi:N-acetylglucosaminyldiphosphoundecaprenol N-acetyl-beta-D-mannosaminyltransferase
MALGKPIVSTDLNECRKYKPILIGKTYAQFLEKIEESLEGLGKEYKENEKEVALNNTWNAKAKDIIKGLEKFEIEYPYLLPKNITMARILYKLYSQSNKYNVNNQIEKTLDNKEKLFLVTMNSETCIYAMKDEVYQNIVMDDDVLLVPDSISISYAIKKVFGKKLKRYPGIEVLSYTLEQLNEKCGTIYLFGATKKVNKDMVHVIKKDYKNIKIIGSCDGYVDDYEKVKDEIVELKPDLTVVALGVPTQELFINDIYKRLHKGMFIGVGGSLDVLSGNKKRAPLFMRRINLEWLYRIVTDPKRIRRFYNNNIKFVNDVRKGKTK